MTQANSNLLLRETAIPYLGQIMGYNRSEQSDQDVSKASALGDLNNLANNTTGGYAPQKDNMIRILRPRYGRLVEAYLSVVLITAPTETAPRFYISVGTAFQGASVYALPIAATPNGATIQSIHKALTGSSTPFQNTAGLPIVVEKLRITQFVPTTSNNGQNAREECFMVGIHFDKTPDNSTGYKLLQFQVDMSALVTRS